MFRFRAKRWSRRGDAARDRRDWRLAAECYRVSLASAPERAAVWVQYGHAVKEAGDAAAAEGAYRTALLLRSDHAGTYLHLGGALQQSGRLSDAADAYRRAAELDPNLVAAQDGLRNVEEAMARPAEPPPSPPQPRGPVWPKLLPRPPRLAAMLDDIEVTKLSLKALGSELAVRTAAALSPPGIDAPSTVGLGSKPCTQADLETPWAAYWSRELRLQRQFHRKQWELFYVLQALHERGGLAAGRRGLGFGCGHEPLPSYFVSCGIDVTITDLAPDRVEAGPWQNSGQHATALAPLWDGRYIDRETFLAHAALRHVDMNDIPDDLRDYDFCWSICALEHLGSIRLGLDFIRNSLKTLRPGGVAVHTTEFNLWSDGGTLDHMGTVLFQQRHFIELAAQLEAEGHCVAPLDFDPGNGPLDRFIDVPPFRARQITEGHFWPLAEPAHLKVSIRGFPCTIFGMIVRKGA